MALEVMGNHPSFFWAEYGGMLASQADCHIIRGAQMGFVCALEKGSET